MFPVSDPAFDALDPIVDTGNRRLVLSCYSWPGMDPTGSMKVYGEQIEPLLELVLREPGGWDPEQGSRVERVAMAPNACGLSLGFPRMHAEAGERRDFHPWLVGRIAEKGIQVLVESGIGSAIGLIDEDYIGLSPNVRVVDHDEAYRQRVVVILRAPEDSYDKLLPGASLFSMLHLPTHPRRVELLRSLGLERSIAMDCIVDDRGKRLVEDGRAVAWNGLEAAFDALERTWPGLSDPTRRPVRVTIMGAGEIGRHAVEAATKFGCIARNEAFMDRGLPGVEVMTISRNMTADAERMQPLLARTDVLVDATKRRDPTRPIIPNGWLGMMPAHAVVCDLVVDPYEFDATPPTVRGIEGIPQGALDRFVFEPDDPAWDLVPSMIPTTVRRTVVSRYAWPGVHPLEAMEHYCVQLWPLLEALIDRKGVDGLRVDGSFHERALRRATLRWWVEGPATPASQHAMQSGFADLESGQRSRQLKDPWPLSVPGGGSMLRVAPRDEEGS